MCDVCHASCLRDFRRAVKDTQAFLPAIKRQSEARRAMCDAVLRWHKEAAARMKAER